MSNQSSDLLILAVVGIGAYMLMSRRSIASVAAGSTAQQLAAQQYYANQQAGRAAAYQSSDQAMWTTLGGIVGLGAKALGKWNGAGTTDYSLATTDYGAQNPSPIIALTPTTGLGFDTGDTSGLGLKTGGGLGLSAETGYWAN